MGLGPQFWNLSRG